MKKAFLLLILLYLFVFMFRCAPPPAEEAKPEILNVGTSGVTISWLSREPYKGRVFYRPTGTEAGPSRAAEKVDKTRQHEITITGLKPASHYTYWIGENGKHHRFQTQPPVNTPFSFIMVYGDFSRDLTHLLTSEVPDFFISLNPITGAPDLFSDVRAYVPVFDLAGADLVYQKTVDDHRPGMVSPGLSWKLDWGGLRLIFIRGLDALPGLLETPAPHTFGIITAAGLLDAFTPPQKADPDSIRAAELHSALLAHNRQNPARPASFVWVTGSKGDAVEVDGIHYLGVPVEKQGPGGKGKAVRVDIDVESARAVLLDEQKEITLRNPPVKGKRTCHECRRLADKGAYEQSIAAYKEFIEYNRGHYQIDDAYFAIAEIYDEKLFIFTEAMTWYQRLIKEHPSGTLTALAGQRITYLKRYSDYDFKPLQGFDRIRKVDFSRKKDQKEEQLKLLNQVETIIKEYPDCNLAPVMQHWLANRFRQFSIDKALVLYNQLKEKYPNSAESKEVSLEIGETYYNAGLYKEAIISYQKALKELPGKKKTIDARINRSKRNIRREVLAAAAWIIAAVFCLLTLLLRPVGLDFSRIGRGILVFVILGIILLFGAWLIHEQFPSVRQMWLFVGLFAVSAGLSSFLSVNFAQKLAGSRKVLKTIIGSLTGILFFLTGFYLTIYYVNVHYLTVFKL
jgi:tetratricopeptide (TPR) repeat protein